MSAALWRGAVCVALSLSLCANAQADPLPEHEVRTAMVGVEALLLRQGIDAGGYSGTTPPPVELVAASHPYLQGRDGGYVEGHIYLNGEAIAACTDLTLLHELVHDAAAKRRLFSEVDNLKLRDAFEALADTVTEQAAREPYRPGCVPHRRFGVDTAALAEMANRDLSNPEAGVPAEQRIYLFFTRRRTRLSDGARELIAEAMCRVSARTSIVISVVDAGEDVAPTHARGLDARRVRTLQRGLLKLGFPKDWIVVAQHGESGPAVSLAAHRAPPLIDEARAGAGRGLLPP